MKVKIVCAENGEWIRKEVWEGSEGERFVTQNGFRLFV